MNLYEAIDKIISFIEKLLPFFGAYFALVLLMMLAVVIVTIVTFVKILRRRQELERKKSRHRL